ncbi:GNAT family N-acetyltransferase [Streptomyces malaysiensis subsp. malaysiensis]|uniref:GNAT family N-acetyltransferase n=1 Tax=Streptomyces malaysiensis TaxID=92644 RepID=A0ABX6WEC9_STRMQ|nr:MULTISPECIES: GNAT family N-acetyltransferase [Streptomyces]QPI59521.1 GNAT family N-acetyltransferase [Streptomyces solisilvae]UHH21180.1 GNAT family N-acetyltransferase [Streptomyces sp. HNM0561]
MAWTVTYDLEEFRAAAGGFLRARPARHTTLLTVVSSLVAAGSGRYGDQPPVYGWWTGAGPVEGAFLCTPPYPPLLSELSGEAARELARTLARDGERQITGVNAGRETAETFATAWQALTGAVSGVEQAHRLYRLDGLTPPDPAPPGRPRTAATADRDLLITWCEGFARETGALRGDVAALVDDKLAHGGITLWELDGRPVACAGITRTVADMARVALVYTPPELRGRGYAGAATAAVSRAARDAGVKEILLFTDVANPTSNALYQRLGYRPLEDHLVLSFSSASSASSTSSASSASSAGRRDPEQGHPS